MELSTWPDIYKRLSEFPKEWAFRGHEDASYKLEPTLERAAKDSGIEWSELELRVSPEFKARARSHLQASMIPQDPDPLTLTWLSLMRHYGFPTRLLDFTYSPFIALYFAIRGGHKKKEAEAMKALTPTEEEQLVTLLTKAGRKPRTHVGLWAVDTKAVNDRFESVAGVAGVGPGLPRAIWSGNLYDFTTGRDSIADDQKRFSALIEGALSARGRQRAKLKERGCVCATLPSEFNPRLVNQQGLFLINCAEELRFRVSLTTMMGKHHSRWKETFEIPVSLIPKIEEQLFRMNIHEQTLFPDLGGLAGFLDQKIRLHWS